MAKTKIVQTEGEEVEKEVLAKSIVAISESMQKLRRSGINERAIVALIKDDTGFGKGVIETVLGSIAMLKQRYTS